MSKTVRTTERFMAAIFEDNQGVIHVNYLIRGTTLDRLYYADLAFILCESIKEQRPGNRRGNVLLQQDSAPALTSQVAVPAVRECRSQLLPHQLYFTGLFLSDYFISSKLKTELQGQRYDVGSEPTLTPEEFCKEHDSTFYREVQMHCRDFK